MESEVKMLRTRLADKNDQLTSAKMKIDELRVLKNDKLNFATSELQEKLKRITTEHKLCSQTIDEQNHEVGFFYPNFSYFIMFC